MKTLKKSIGIPKNNTHCFEKGCIIIFNKSLIPSANGWSTPTKVTLLGPNRVCVRPNILRSNRVKKATPPIPSKTVKINCVIHNDIITTLFSIFAPVLISIHSVQFSVLVIILLLRIIWEIAVVLRLKIVLHKSLYRLTQSLFPSRKSSSVLFVRLFLILRIINVISLTIYAYPLTTTLRFNFTVALLCWISRILLILIKKESFSSIIPLNSP